MPATTTAVPSIHTPAIELRAVSKCYTPAAAAVRDVSLRLEPGALLALLGPSGCGKTTTLRLIAGLECPDTGEVCLGGRVVAGRGVWTPPEQRGVSMVFQDYALFPHLTVAENIAFPISRLPARERAARVAELLPIAGLDGLGDRYPHQLSGGQQQRVALARALAPRPTVVLLDEPFSNLDAALRKSTREEVRRILRDSGATAVFVTHDQEEAFSVADTVAVMRAGEVDQLAPPHEVYLRPSSRAVASFVGEANFLPAQALGDLADCALGTVPLAAPAFGRVDLLVRPEMLSIRPEPRGCGRIEQITFFGHDQLVSVRMCDGALLHARTFPRLDLAAGAQVEVRVDGPLVSFAPETS
jgi:iron(III) transport system ATP-binding protein